MKSIYSPQLMKINFYLFLSIPFLLISGPFLSDLAVTLMSIFTLIYIIKNKDYKYLKNRYVIFLAFYFYLILNSLLINTNFDS